MRSLRAKQFDLVLLPSGGDQAHALKLARMIKPGKVARLCADQGPGCHRAGDNKPQLGRAHPRCCRRWACAGQAIASQHLCPATKNACRAHGAGASQYRARPAQTADGLHISARKPASAGRPSALSNWPLG